MTSKRSASTRRQHARVTARDVASVAGVSPMTVSRVINGEASVRQATRDAVQRAIDDLGYSPNKAARSLASATQLQIGLIYTNPSSPYLSAMLFGVLEQARESDTQIVVEESEEGDGALRAVRHIIQGGADGLLLTPPIADDTKVLALLHEMGISAVTLGSRHDELGIPSVCCDEYAAVRSMMQHLFSLGHRRIGYVKGHPDHQSSAWRFQAYLDALEDAGIELDEQLVVPGRYSYRSGLDAAERLLAGASKPSAIFASNDDMAAATVATAHRHHIEVPDELTVVGFDNTFLATAIWPELTTIHQPIADMAHAAIKLLEKIIRARRGSQEPNIEHLQLESRLVRRQSDGPPPARR